ncbi:hypothetical protein [Pedobacter mendelii]|uniref:LysM domain-containing protein n=1 Tax=Pedobacter mendelii TaxID=1908240 RepID=A0ABQ2BQM8_9SPHI|nr:hypothetical protein [Pedobacter mendelii]GGI29147.1 hypothetical protein GCM10008119_36190 [Pedobacter mendelii]
MAKSISLKNRLNLVHDLKVQPEVNAEKISVLLNQLKKSDVSPLSVRPLKTESITQVTENIRNNELLTAFSELKIPKIENDQFVVRRETPFSALTNITLPASLASSNNALTALGGLSSVAAASKTLGPFTSNDGRLVWYDFFNYEKLIPIYLNGDAKPLMLIPIKSSLISRPTGTYSLTKGSIWIRADLFAPAAGNAKYTGFKITSGKIIFSKVTPIVSDSIKFAPEITFTLELNLDNSFTPKNEGAFGLDSRNADVKPPDLITLSYTAKKLSITRIGPASWQLYGDGRSFNYTNKPINFSAPFDKILIPLQTDSVIFKPVDVKSTFFKLDGEAAIKTSYWSLSLNELDVTKPFSIRNNGALALFCSQGLNCSWQGLDKRLPIELISPYIFAEQGLFLIHELKADFKTLEENFKLWDISAETGIKAGLKLSFNRKRKFDYTCQEEGIEGIVATADAYIDADKPLQADGTAVAPKTKDSIYLKYASASSSQIIVIDQDMLSEQNIVVEASGDLISAEKFKEIKKTDSRYRFALENAYLLSTPPAALMLAASWNSENLLTKGKLTILYGLTDLIPTLPHPYTTEALYKPSRAATTFRDVASYNQSMAGLLTSICDWEENEAGLAMVKVDFKLTYNTNQVIPAMIQTPSNDSENTNVQAFSAMVATGHGTYDRMKDSSMLRTPHVFSLLDLSTNYDLLGISMSFNQVRMVTDGYAKIKQTAEQVVTIEKMNLRSPMAMLNGFTLPHITWEPLINLTPPDDSTYPKMGILGFSDQGPATVFTQLDSRAIDIDPLKYMQRFRRNLKPDDVVAGAQPVAVNPIEKDGNLRSSILFGLPNGKFSIANLIPFNPQQATLNNRHLDFIIPEFELQQLKLKGGMQFRLAANKPLESSNPPELQGLTVQMKNLIDEWSGPLPQSILGESVHKMFNGRFAESGSMSTGIPLTHIDFSGYGASMFSNWLAPLAKFASISQVKFDVMRGRLSHEIVQAVSMLYPWGICVVRTITFFRRNNAIIYREDSGWQAKSEGIFDFSFETKSNPAGNNAKFENPYYFYPGLVGGLYNVHNIKEVTGDIIKVDYTPQEGEYWKTNPSDYVHRTGSGTPVHAEFIGVTFDADANLDVEGKGVKYVKHTGKQFKGYLQLSPEGVPVPQRVFRELMIKAQNSVGGNVDCILNLGASTQTIQVNRVDVSASYKNNNPSEIIFVAAAKGSVQLPADGSWSVVELDKISGDVLPVANKESVPVIRDGLRDRYEMAFKVAPSLNISKITFPDALLNTVSSFAKRYGFVQNTGTQKLLMVDPKYDITKIGSLLTEAPLLADSFRLLNSKGPFPNMGNAIKIEDVTTAVTKILPNGLSKVINGFKVPDNFTFDVIGSEGSPFRMYIKYKSDPKTGPSSNTLVDYVTDSAAATDKWKNELGNMSIVVDLASFKSLMTISGDFKAKVSVNPGFESGKAPQLKLAEPLEKIYQILEFLDNLDPTQPVEVVKKGLKIAMSNSADSWDYKFKASKEIPFVKFPFDPINYNSPTTPLKLDAYFKIGCYFNQPIKIPKTIDQVMPSAGAFLELGADLRVMCVSLAAATIYATGRAEVGLAADLKNPPTLYFKFGFGVELCVGLPVIGSVAVMYMVGVDMSLNTEELIVGAFIYFRGRAEIFGGIVTITIQIEAAGKIQKQLNGGPTSCIAICTFALDISIFWVIDISFSETWEETRQIA